MEKFKFSNVFKTNKIVVLVTSWLLSLLWCGLWCDLFWKMLYHSLFSFCSFMTFMCNFDLCWSWNSWQFLSALKKKYIYISLLNFVSDSPLSHFVLFTEFWLCTSAFLWNLGKCWCNWKGKKVINDFDCTSILTGYDFFRLGSVLHRM